MAKARKGYPSDVSDEEWEFCAPYLTLMKEDAPQRKHSLRDLFNGLGWFLRAGCPWRMLPNDLPPWQAVQQQTERWLAAQCFERMTEDLRLLLRLGQERKGRKVHAAVDTLGHLLAVKVTAADEQDRAQVGALAQAVQEATGERVEIAYVDQGYTGEEPTAQAAAQGIRLEVGKHHEAKRGFILLPPPLGGRTLVRLGRKVPAVGAGL